MRQPPPKGRVCLAALALLCSLSASCGSSALQVAQEHVPIGTKRSDAIRILDGETWYHQLCPNVITVDDLFFYGSRGYDKAQVVIVSSEPLDGVYYVYAISSFENYAWHTAYADCIDVTRFDH